MMSDNKFSRAEPDMKGWLFKWTNYIKGYQRRWFILNNGVLSYYRNPSEVTHMCRGTINLHGATIYTVDSCTFVISNGNAQTFHIKASSEVERQRWVTTLELAKVNALTAIQSETKIQNSADTAKIEVAHAIQMLNNKIEDLKYCNSLIITHGNALQRSLSELEYLDNNAEISLKAKEINERATLFRITSSSMINVSTEYMELAQTQGKKWQKMLQHEREQRIQLEEMVEQLAKEQSALERTLKHCPTSTDTQDGISDDENTEFFDAQCGDVSESSNYNSNSLNRHDSFSDTQVFDKLVSEELAADDGSSSDVDDIAESAAILTAAIRSSANIKNKSGDIRYGNGGVDNIELSSRGEMLPVLSENAKKLLKTIREKPWKHGSQRRTSIPDKPNHHLHIWSIMKNCIGKDLSKIPMPVNFSEPLSMLQRLTEDFEYSKILDVAANCSDPFERLAYIAAFTISCYSAAANRTGKPFNPLLGETYECDRMEDLGWRAINEQVSHHPPIAAQHCEGKQWISWQEFTMSSKFRGKYLQVIPTGTSHLKFKNDDDYYTWSKVTTTVHNIIVGKLWVDQEGEMEICSHKTGNKCHLIYIPYSYFSRDQQRKVRGTVTNNDGEVKYLVSGTWDNKVEIAPVIKVDESGIVEGPYREVWQRVVPPENSYNFTLLACQLNEMEADIAPTDSRLRPDQRLMELGLWDEANIEKLRLEEKQRQQRKQTHINNNSDTKVNENGEYRTDKPCWFTKVINPETGDVSYSYSNEYWSSKVNQLWDRCPNIY